MHNKYISSKHIHLRICMGLCYSWGYSHRYSTTLATKDKKRGARRTTIPRSPLSKQFLSKKKNIQHTINYSCKSMQCRKCKKYVHIYLLVLTCPLEQYCNKYSHACFACTEAIEQGLKCGPCKASNMLYFLLSYPVTWVLVVGVSPWTLFHPWFFVIWGKRFKFALFYSMCKYNIFIAPVLDQLNSDKQWWKWPRFNNHCLDSAPSAPPPTITIKKETVCNKSNNRAE